MSSPANLDSSASACRWLRRGSIALIVATFVPSLSFEIFVLNVHTVQFFAWALKRPHGYGYLQRHLMFVFAAYTWPLLFTGWLGLWISRTPDRFTGPPARGIVRFARLLFLATWILPCLNAVAYHVRFGAFGTIPFVVGTVCYLVLGFSIRTLAERRAGTPLIVVWYMALPVTATLVAWVCITILFYRQPNYVLMLPIGLGGAWGTFVGFVGWAQVLRADNFAKVAKLSEVTL